MGEGATMDWYVIHTYSGHENKVKNNLERAIHAAGLEPHFGQILVEMDLNQETRLVAQNVPGVTRFVGSGQEPIPLREAEVKRILGHMEAGGRLRGSAEVPFKSGEHVKVVDGPFTDFTGVVDEVNPERQKVKVMVSIFGRATPVELDFLQVQPV